MTDAPDWPHPVDDPLIPLRTHLLNTAPAPTGGLIGYCSCLGWTAGRPLADGPLMEAHDGHLHRVQLVHRLLPEDAWTGPVAFLRCRTLEAATAVLAHWEPRHDGHMAAHEFEVLLTYTQRETPLEIADWADAEGHLNLNELIHLHSQLAT